MRKIIYLTIILSAGLIASCKKDNHNNNNTTTASYINLDKDSIYYYEKEDYLWFDALPAYNTFNPRSFTGSTDYEALGNEITAISQLKINPSTGKPYEYYKPDPGQAKYSFIDDGTTTASLGGSNADFGFEPIYKDRTGTDLRVKYVYPGSPADLAGIKRGYEITSINGSTNINGSSQSNINYIINAVYYSPSITMVLKKYDNTSFTATINTASYAVNPVLTYKVFNEGGGHEVGYIAFNSFTDLTNAKPKLNQAFNYFITNGVNDLVVDLRYNGGGAGETAEYMDDLIAPSSTTGTLMYTTYFNSNLQGGKSPLLDKRFGFVTSDFAPANNQVGFNKVLSLSINRVFFIVTSETASSSELTINNLRPEMDVELVGDTTYGKPVGEIPIPLGSDGKYILYSPQISVENSANQGDYYAGMTPGSGGYKGSLQNDDVTKDFGDSTENMLAHTLSYVKTGTYAINNPQVQSLLAGKQLFSITQQKAIVRQMDQHKYKPLIVKKKHK